MRPLTKETATPEHMRELSEKGNLAKKQRKTLREIFKYYLDDVTQEHIAQYFVGLLTEDGVRVSDKIKIVEVILKCIGEYDSTLTKAEFTDMKHIVLKIED